jgi:hypothetical protein
VLKRTGRSGEFHVLALGGRGGRRVVARSPSPFKVMRSGHVPARGDARQAHRQLVRQLLDAGWTRVASRGRWHDTTFTRQAVPGARRRLQISIAHQGGKGRFEAIEHTDYGTERLLGTSDEFEVASNGVGIVATEAALCAHCDLIADLAAMGWVSTGQTAGGWFAQFLAAPDDDEET